MYKVINVIGILIIASGMILLIAAVVEAVNLLK